MIFTDPVDEVPQRRRMSIRSVVAALCVACFAVAIAVFYEGSDGFTRGVILDLPSNERTVLDRIQDSGVVVGDTGLSCTMEPHIVVTVNWQSSTGKYAVTAISLMNAPFELVRSEIKYFTALKEIHAPYLRQTEVEAIQRQVPQLAVSRGVR